MDIINRYLYLYVFGNECYVQRIIPKISNLHPTSTGAEALGSGGLY